jgi:hypothetical protein
VVRIDLGADGAGGEGAGGAPGYRPARVDRKALFAFGAGRTVFELVDPDGVAFVMQAHSLAVDPTLGEESLAALGDRLELPAGWRFVGRVLEAPLAVDTRRREALVVQDELQNTYCRYG